QSSCAGSADRGSNRDSVEEHASTARRAKHESNRARAPVEFRSTMQFVCTTSTLRPQADRSAADCDGGYDCCCLNRAGEAASHSSGEFARYRVEDALPTPVGIVAQVEVVTHQRVHQRDRNLPHMLGPMVN